MRRLNAVRSKKDLVIAEIREAILNGELAPGTRLVIDDLAEKLGVSSIPVREALQQLHADGYIVFEPFVGARVAEIAAESIVEVFTLLEAMEVTSSRLACGRLAPEELAELETIVAHMDTLISDAEAWSRENRHFHELICARASRHPLGGRSHLQGSGPLGSVAPPFFERSFCASSADRPKTTLADLARDPNPRPRRSRRPCSDTQPKRVAHLPGLFAAAKAFALISLTGRRLSA